MARMTEQEFAELMHNRRAKLGEKLPQIEVKRNKYNNVITEYNGVRYHSKKEAKRAQELDLMVLAGEITNLRRQVRYPLVVNDIKVTTYVADFVYFDKRKGEEVIEDVKGKITDSFRIKSNLMRAFGKIIYLT